MNLFQAKFFQYYNSLAKYFIPQNKYLYEFQEKANHLAFYGILINIAIILLEFFTLGQFHSQQILLYSFLALAVISALFVFFNQEKVINRFIVFASFSVFIFLAALASSFSTLLLLSFLNIFVISAYLDERFLSAFFIVNSIVLVTNYQNNFYLIIALLFVFSVLLFFINQIKKIFKLAFSDFSEVFSRNFLLEKKLQSKIEEMDDFTYVLSHDLKSSTRGISTLSQWIKSDYAEKFDEEGKNNLELLIDRVERLGAFIEGLLDYAKFLKQDIKVQVIEPSKIIHEIIEDLKKDNITENKKLNFKFETDLPQIRYDRNQLIQILGALISNGIKYNKNDEILISIGIEKGEKFFKIWVRDNGIGIDTIHQNKIFKLFQILGDRNIESDLGIGLPTAKKIIELNGGEISVESKLGKGSTFIFTIPASGL